MGYPNLTNLQKKLTEKEIDQILQAYEQDKFDKKRELNISDNIKKSEFIKDVISIANVPKNIEGYLFFGWDNAGNLVGLNKSVDGATLEQMVNSKLYHKVNFDYFEQNYKGKMVGICRIANFQKRPLMLQKNFGKLKKGIVYIRNGSSTGPATPDQIIAMVKMGGLHFKVLRKDLEKWLENLSNMQIPSSREEIETLYDMNSLPLQEHLQTGYPDIWDRWTKIRKLHANISEKFTKFFQKSRQNLVQEINLPYNYIQGPKYIYPDTIIHFILIELEYPSKEGLSLKTYEQDRLFYLTFEKYKKSAPSLICSDNALDVQKAAFTIDSLAQDGEFRASFRYILNQKYEYNNELNLLRDDIRELIETIRHRNRLKGVCHQC